MIVQIIHSQFLYIGLECVLIAFLLYYVIKWSKEYKKWKEEMEIREEENREHQLEEALVNPMRRSEAKRR